MVSSVPSQSSQAESSRVKSSQVESSRVKSSQAESNRVKSVKSSALAGMVSSVPIEMKSGVVSAMPTAIDVLKTSRNTLPPRMAAHAPAASTDERLIRDSSETDSCACQAVEVSCGERGERRLEVAAGGDGWRPCLQKAASGGTHDAAAASHNSLNQRTSHTRSNQRTSHTSLNQRTSHTSLNQRTSHTRRSPTQARLRVGTERKDQVAARSGGRGPLLLMGGEGAHTGSSTA